jgi:hypothetical protein
VRLRLFIGPGTKTIGLTIIVRRKKEILLQAVLLIFYNLVYILSKKKSYKLLSYQFYDYKIKIKPSKRILLGYYFFVQPD